MYRDQIQRAYFYDLIEIREEWGARSPGWFKAECDLCDGYMTGSEPSVEDWAWEHVTEHETDALTAGFPG